MSFDQLNLDSKILKAVKESGYTTPTPIQLQVIPEVLKNLDIRASAQTGTGKTAAFLLPTLHRLASQPVRGKKGPQVLVLVPTRELGMQIAQQAEKYSKHLEFVKTVCIGGGVPYDVQLRKLKRPYEILIATPGRLIDFMHQKKIDLSNVDLLILDEADRMLDMGFIDPVKEIAAATNPKRQTLLFSATLQGSVIKLSESLMQDPIEIRADVQYSSHENIAQKIHYVDDLHHKNRVLDHLLKENECQPTIIFTATKRHADQLSDELEEKGFLAAALHGDMSQRQRTRTLKQLKDGKVEILVATDVAARGIDVQSISHVINFDFPRNTEDYVHRIGRTGRAGAKGTAFSFATNSEAMLVQQVEKYTGVQIDIIEIAGLEATIKKRSSERPKRPFRSFKGGGGGGGGGPYRSRSGGGAPRSAEGGGYRSKSGGGAPRSAEGGGYRSKSGGGAKVEGEPPLCGGWWLPIQKWRGSPPLCGGQW
jgi:superfamily II DNA/RNA helicase